MGSKTNYDFKQYEVVPGFVHLSNSRLVRVKKQNMSTIHFRSFLFAFSGPFILVPWVSTDDTYYYQEHD